MKLYCDEYRTEVDRSMKQLVITIDDDDLHEITVSDQVKNGNGLTKLLDLIEDDYLAVYLRDRGWEVTGA